MGGLSAGTAYIDGELCGVGPDGVTSFSVIQAASDGGKAAALVFFAFDLLFVNDEATASLPLVDRKERLQRLLTGTDPRLQYSDHKQGRGPEFHAQACRLRLEGIVSKRPTLHTRQVTAACGSRRSASIARNSSWSAGPIRKALGPISAPCC